MLAPGYMASCLEWGLALSMYHSCPAYPRRAHQPWRPGAAVALDGPSQAIASGPLTPFLSSCRPQRLWA